MRVTAREKEKIERLAKRRGINISEYLRQNAVGKSNEERSERWYSIVESLEKICSLCDGEAKVQLIVRMYEPIITEFFDNEEEMAKFQKWREEYEEKERLEKEEKAKKKAGAA